MLIPVALKRSHVYRPSDALLHFQHAFGPRNHLAHPAATDEKMIAGRFHSSGEGFSRLCVYGAERER